MKNWIVVFLLGGCSMAADDNFDDEICKRQMAKALLEGDSQLFRNSRGNVDDPQVYGTDDLDVADAVFGAIPDGPDAGLTKKVSLRDIKWNELVQTAPFMRINPPTALQGTVGGQQKVFVGQHIQVANWGGKDAECCPITVTLAPVQGLVGQYTLTPLPYGIVRWGTRGFLVSAEVDIGTGTQFTVGGSYATIEVALEDVLDPAISSTNPNDFANLAGMLSFWPVVRTKPITRTKSFPLGGVNVQKTIDIPPFAKDFLVVFSNPALFGAGEKLLVQQQSTAVGTGISVYTYSLDVTSEIRYLASSPTTLAGFASKLLFQTTAAVSQQVYVIFGLDL